VKPTHRLGGGGGGLGDMVVAKGDDAVE